MAAGGGGGVTQIIGAVIGNITTRLGARESARALLQQATDADIQAEIEELNAKTTENDLRANLMRTLASNNAAFAASGGAFGSPSFTASVEDDLAVAMGQIGGVRLDALLKASALRRSASQLRRQGKYTAILGNLGASAQTLGSTSGFQGFAGAQPTNGGSAFKGGGVTGDFSSATA